MCWGKNSRIVVLIFCGCEQLISNLNGITGVWSEIGLFISTPDSTFFFFVNCCLVSRLWSIVHLQSAVIESEKIDLALVYGFDIFWSNLDETGWIKSYFVTAWFSSESHNVIGTSIARHREIVLYELTTKYDVFMIEFRQFMVLFSCWGFDGWYDYCWLGSVLKDITPEM